MKIFTTTLLLLSSFAVKAQKVDSIFFNLYTDSLKKGTYNYINVDAKFSNGTYLPLMSTDVDFSSTGGKFDGNSLIIDSSFKKPFVVVTAKLKANPAVIKSVTIYIKKFENLERLKTQQEVMEGIRNSGRKKRNYTSNPA